MGSLYFAITILSTVCFSFGLRCCKEENYLNALLLTIFYICLILFLDFLKEYAGSGFWLDFSRFMFFLDLTFFFFSFFLFFVSLKLIN